MQLAKVAVVTGASRGIGRAVALGLAEDGYDVVLIARTENKLIALENQIKKFGVKSKIICTDITDFDFLTQALNAVIKEWGRVDVLVNNAGIYRDGTLEASLDDYQAVFEVNLKAQLVMIKTILPVMQKQKSGLIVNVASISGKVGYSASGAYCSSKFALVGLSESLYNEYSSQGIKITSICPSYVATDMAKDAGAEIPENEMIQTADILQTIRWLLQLSPYAFVKEIVLDIAP